VQAGWWTLFGYWSIQQLQRIYANDLGCASELGAFRLCDASLHLSIYSSLFLLMTQALVRGRLASSRNFCNTFTRCIAVPGMSNFVNSSVRRLILLEHASRRLLAHLNPNPCFVAEMHSRTGQIFSNDQSRHLKSVMVMSVIEEEKI
jgi:hypothetical protein